MIKTLFYKNKNGTITGFEMRDHGLDIVCAAVSILAQNTVNSIEAFTDCEFTCDFEENGGYMEFKLSDTNFDEKADLLLNSLYLGITGIKEQYGDNLELSIKEVQ